MARQYPSSERPFTVFDQKSPSMPNIPGFYTNRAFRELDAANKNVTLVRAANKNDLWDYDKTERRHKSTNVLTYKVRNWRL